MEVEGDWHHRRAAGRGVSGLSFVDLAAIWMVVSAQGLSWGGLLWRGMPVFHHKAVEASQAHGYQNEQDHGSQNAANDSCSRKGDC